MDDEMLKQWEGVSKEEDKITTKRNTMRNMKLTCANVADDSGCFGAQQAMDDNGILDKMTENTDQDQKSA